MSQLSVLKYVSIMDTISGVDVDNSGASGDGGSKS